MDPKPPPVPPRPAIRQYHTGAVANAIDCFGVRLRNERYTLPGLSCVGTKVTAALLTLAMLLAAGCNGQQKEGAQPLSRPTVAVAKAAKGDVTRALVMTAEFRPFQEIELMAKVSGYVKEIRVDIGDRVRKGEIIAVLEVPEMADDLARAKSALKASQAEAVRARDELKRVRSLRDIARLSYLRLAQVEKRRPGLIAQQEIDDARAKSVAAEAQVAASRSALDAANQQVEVRRGALGRVRVMLDYATVTAPFGGVVVRRFADVGSMIQAGTASKTQAMPLIRLADDSVLRLIIPVPESAVPMVRIGKGVEVRVPSLDRTLSGRVTRFTTSLATDTRTMDTEVDVVNPGLAMVPGMYAQVRMELERHQGVLTVPIAAVDQGEATATVAGRERPAGRQGRVLVVTPENRIQSRQLSLGIETAYHVEVLSGLREGELVVTGGRGTLQPGAIVQPKLLSTNGNVGPDAGAESAGGDTK